MGAIISEVRNTVVSMLLFKSVYLLDGLNLALNSEAPSAKKRERKNSKLDYS